MTRVTDETITRAATFIWTGGRVVEQRRFAYLFGDGSAAGVRAALDAYRADDGGFAFGLEPDVRGPASQPISVPSALKVLAEIGALDRATAEPICDWLATLTPADGGAPAVLPTLRPYPRPPWLPVPDGEVTGHLLATGQIAGPLLAHGIAHPWLDGAVEFCWRAVEAIGKTHPYDVKAALDFLEHAPDRARAAAEAERLGKLVREQRIVLLDPAHPEEAEIQPGYAPGEYHFPHDYATTPDSLAAAWFSTEEIGRGLDALVADQQEDGGWPIRWARWAPTTVSEARPTVTIEALQILRAWDRVSLTG